MRRDYSRRYTTLLVKARASKGDNRLAWVRRVGGLGALVAVLVAGIVAGSVFGVERAVHALFAENSVFEIKRLDVTSDGSLTPGYIASRANLECGSNLFGIDLAQKKKLIEMIPAVRSAVLSRVLPDTLRVRVVERSPISRLRRAGYYLYIDADGHVLGEQHAVPGLPSITGFLRARLYPGEVVTDSRVLAALRLLVASDTTTLGSVFKIERVDVGKKKHMDVYLASGTWVLFPLTDAKRKLGELASVMKNLRVAERGRVRVDLRFKEPAVAHL